MLTPLDTARLELIPLDHTSLAGSLKAPADFGLVLGREVATDWPPMHWDEGPVGWLLNKLRECPDEPFWRAWLIAVRSGPVIGTVGAKGPPDNDGCLEVGYSVVASHWRRGIATEAVGGLLGWAASDPRVLKFSAHTLTGDPASSGVLRKLGFELVATIEDPTDGRIDRFEREKTVPSR
ncbi:MAG: GNAT family N-acetyltransferase [Phycisphaerales bacterium]